MRERSDERAAERAADKASRRNTLKNVKWVAHYLGVSRNTIHQWVLEGHIPYINLGVAGGRRIIRFEPETVEAWLRDRTFAPAAEEQNPAKLKGDLDTKKQDIE